MKNEAKVKVKARVNRIAGQIGGIQRMIEDDKYCVDILNQISAVRSALDSLGIELLTDHLETCVIGHGTESEHHCAKPMTQEDLLDEVRTALGRFLK
ncbi:MAG: metal-sensitive transcriptional regulator [Armatimonadota bacterium]